MNIKYYHQPVISYGVYTTFKFPKFIDLPIHEYIYIGGEDFIRGYSSDPFERPENKNIEVSNVVYSYIELQSTILKKKDYGKIEFGIDGLMFINSGIGSKSIDKLAFPW